MHDYLQAILTHKYHEVEQLLAAVAEDANHPLKKILIGEGGYYPKKSLRHVLTLARLAVIAEIKRRSPSKKHIAEIIDPVALAKQYISGGAAAISVLTDNFGFGGCLADLTTVAKFAIHSPVAILRKDFIVDEIQIAESILAGADAILLIVSVLQDRTASLLAAARRMRIDALVEVHTAAELEYTLEIGAEIIGVNNRNLTSFEVDLNCARQLVKKIPASVVTVAESGIDSPQVGAELAAQGFNALLIGESLVKSNRPDLFIRELQQLFAKNASHSV